MPLSATTTYCTLVAGVCLERQEWISLAGGIVSSLGAFGLAVGFEKWRRNVAARAHRKALRVVVNKLRADIPRFDFALAQAMPDQGSGLPENIEIWRGIVKLPALVDAALGSTAIDHPALRIALTDLQQHLEFDEDAVELAYHRLRNQIEHAPVGSTTRDIIATLTPPLAALQRLL